MSQIDRRDFLKFVGASAGAAATAGCSDHVSKLIPYVVQPEEITPGIANYYASTCQECPVGCGLHVRTREARPVKLEGNPEHPINRGALCARGQTSIGRTFHPDRFPGPMKRGSDGAWQPISWDEAVDLLADQVRQARGRTWVLGGETGPTESAWIDRWVDAVGAGGRVVYEPFANEALLGASRTVFGTEAEPRFDLSGADFVIDFGSDFLETGLSPTEHARQLAEARDADSAERRGTHFVYVGPRLSMTASNADEWVAAKPGTEGMVALALARVALANGGGTPEARGSLRGLLAGFDTASVAAAAGVPEATLERLGKALAKAEAPVAMPPGAALSSRRATATAGAVLLLDWALGAVGRGVRFDAAPVERKRASYRETLALIDAMKTGKVGVLLVHDSNPAHTLPPSAGFGEALGKVPFVVSFASMPDETTERAQLVLPDHTALESWGDAAPRAGVRSIVQPTLRPIFDTRALVDTLLDTGRKMGVAGLPEQSFRGLVEQAWSGTDWHAALSRGGEFSDAPEQTVSLAEGALRLEVAEPLLEGNGEFALLAMPSPLLFDGRGANLPWLQEIPDPVSKIAWESWAEISLGTAERLGGLGIGDMIAVETSAGSFEVPVLPRGGVRDDVIAIAVGQGHTVGRWASHESDGRPGEARGVNVLELLPALTDESGGRAFLVTKATARASGGFLRLPFVQMSQNQRERGFAKAVSLLALAQGEGHPASSEGESHGGDHGGDHGGGHGVHHLKEYDPAFDSEEDSGYRWGLAMDVDRCNGCSACVAACYIENNIPVVGEEGVRRGRHMAWLRVERWVGDGAVEGGTELPILPDESASEVDIRTAAMMCQHCGAAPCEPVCPVIATYHSPEGLNGMIYNRCIGTRYCSNNCPYKVRRYNWFDYQIEGWPEPMPLMLNPDVTVRGQGVMEKCTFCVQRVAEARQTAKDEGRLIADGEVVTACQQACPTQAIHFGN
ncbi:MAG: molybdopterin-dependent oxidoreductase, partial [Myxococcota bacterium]|nr:molybdopterin-dependent oxidoreductase [Myxococcota bacterium]